MLKKFLIGTLAVVAFMVTANLALASYDFGSAILKVGSRGQYVTTLQNLVGATPIDGLFGPMTKAKVVAWQKAHDLIADGLFGPVSKAKANETGTNFGAGCTNASGFSTTTGLPCSSLNANIFPVGCSNASGFSTTTGFACSSLNAHTFPTGCTNASGFSTTTGLNCLNNLPPIRGGVISGYHVTVESSLVPTADMLFVLTTPVENGGTNHLTGGGATSYVNVGVANGTTSVVITGTKLAGQTVIIAGVDVGTRDDSRNIVVTGTGTNPIYTVNTVTNGLSSPNGPGDNVSLTGGNKTVTFTVSETNKTDIIYTVNVQVATAATIVATAIAGVTVPVTGATPVTTVTAGTGYTGTVTWSGTPSTFASATSYTATITLTATSGYTLTGVSANQFTIAGSTSDTNSANSGVITAVFPATTLADRTSPVFTTTSATTTITITLAGGTFKAAPIVAADFTFGGPNAAAIATYGAFSRTDATHVAITGLSAHLSGVTNNDNTVTVLGATQATQAASVGAVSS